jgi:hypothetical protein
LIGNAGVQRLMVQRAPEGATLTLEDILSSLGKVGAAPPVDTFVDAIKAESPDVGLAAYLRASVRETVRANYNDKDARRILGALLRTPYTPGIQAIFYDSLKASDKVAFDEVNDKVNDEFASETGISGALDWGDPLDRPFARRWLMLRDKVMDGRAKAEEEEAERKFKADLLAKASSPADLHDALFALDAATSLKLLRDTSFKMDLLKALGDWDGFVECFEWLGGRALSASELLANSTVNGAINDAWADSLPMMPVAKSTGQLSTHNHEEGGWIYMNLVTGKVVIRRQEAEGNTSIELDATGEVDKIWISLERPPKVEDCVLVATFHVHPNDARFDGVSEDDWRSADSGQIPGLIRLKSGKGWFGSIERRDTLAGS